MIVAETDGEFAKSPESFAAISKGGVCSAFVCSAFVATVRSCAIDVLLRWSGRRS